MVKALVFQEGRSSKSNFGSKITDLGQDKCIDNKSIDLRYVPGPGHAIQ